MIFDVWSQVSRFPFLALAAAKVAARWSTRSVASP
jgi:hypothetical protein